jgi:hypothetical protein
MHERMELVILILKYNLWYGKNIFQTESSIFYKYREIIKRSYMESSAVVPMNTAARQCLQLLGSLFYGSNAKRRLSTNGLSKIE